MNTYDPLYKLVIVLSPCHPASPQLGSPSSPIVHISPLFSLFSHCFPIVFPLFIFPHCSHCFPICTNTHHTPECTAGDSLVTCGWYSNYPNGILIKFTSIERIRQWMCCMQINHLDASVDQIWALWHMHPILHLCIVLYYL